MPELLLRVCDAEGLIDLIALALVADQRADVAFISQDSRHHRCVPQIFFEDAILGVGQALVQQFHLHERGRFPSLLIQRAGNGLHAAAADIGEEDQSDRFGGFFYDNDLFCVLVLEVAERRDGHDAFFLLLPVTGPHTTAAVAGIEVVDQPLKANDKIVVLIEGVDIFRCGQDPHIMFSEVVDKECGLRPVAAQAGQVFDNNRFDLARFDHLIDFVDSLTVEVHTADIVIEGFAHHLVAVADGKVMPLRLRCLDVSERFLEGRT